MWRVVLVGVLGCSACLRPVAYECASDAQCVKPGASGTCEAEGFCSFPDLECPSEKRFSELAPEGLAGTCVEEEASTGTTAAPAGTSSTTIDPIPTTSSGTDPTTTSGESSASDALTSGPSTSSSSTGEPAMPDPIGWWAMEDDASPRVANDQGTGEVHGTLEGNPEWVEGHIGGALALDGVDDYVRMGQSSVHDLEEFSMAAWVLVRGPSPVAHPSILVKGQNYRLRLESTTTRPGAAFRDPDANEVNASGSITCGFDNEALPVDEWHHVAATYGLDDRTLRLWVDGAIACEITSTGGDGVPTTDPSVLYLGYWSGGEGAYFNGLLDDVRLYDVPLTEAQIQVLANM